MDGVKPVKNLSLIVAIAKNMAIGKENKLLWHLSEDLQRFKRLTAGKVILMGRKTFESLPKRPLPNRTSVVLSDVPGEQYDGCQMVYSLNEALDFVGEREDECFVIGGGMVYHLMMPYVSTLYITWVDKDFEADTFFKGYNAADWVVETEESNYSEENGFTYRYTVYKRPVQIF